MTKLLEQAVEAARRLPSDQQDEIARLVLRLAGEEQMPVQLTTDEQAAIERSKAAATLGEFATDEEVKAVWHRHGI